MSRLTRFSALLLAVAFGVTLSACEKKDVKVEPAPAMEQKPAVAAGGPSCPDTNGQAVYAYITQENPYQKWEMWPGKEALYAGEHPHGAFLTTYLSPLAFYAIQDKAGAIPDTAFVVKENYTPEKTLAAVTVMYKRQGYNPEGGDWFWLKFLPDGTIEAEGKLEGCLGCHASARENDWLLTGPIR